ncbi:MAG: PAS domain S-box protein [Desulfobacterales bacterium]|nr:PAS domain S-box protein [Desulfobacterales bacterium]
MFTAKEQRYFLKAVESFRRRLIVISPAFEILAANNSPEGLQISDIIGQPCHEVFYERSSPCEHCAVEEASVTLRPSLRAKDEQSKDLGKMACLYAYPIFSEGSIEAYVSMDFDLPIQGGIEEKLQHTNMMLRNLIASSVDAVIAADIEGRILVFNDAATLITGHAHAEALEQMHIRDIYPDDRAYEVMQDLRGDTYGGPGKLKFYRAEIMSKAGQAIPIILNASIVYEEGREAATIGFFHDMRETLKMETELKNTQLELLQSEKMASLGKLSAGVAHQLNNPLGGITLYTNLVLEDYELAEEAREDLHRVLRDAERCRDTVKELLEFTRQTRHFMKPNDINQAIIRTLFLLERQPLFQNIEIKKDFFDILPPVTCDLQQMNHVFMNLILNAAQAMEGRGTLTIRTTPMDAGDRIRLSMADTGPGIPEQVLPRIFEPFFTTKEEGEGTGLGLSLVYRIIKSHSGQIKARSIPGEGTTFIIEMPATIENSGDGKDD